MAERTYRIHVAAEMSGLSEALIRAWERRYGAIAPHRTESGYRTYTDRDVEILRRLKRLTEEGVSIGDAVKLLPDIQRELDGRSRPEPSRVDTSPVQRWHAEILAGAEQCDQRRVERTLDEALATLPPLMVYDALLAPVAREVGERWHAGTLTVAQEHLVTQAVLVRLLGLLHAAPRLAHRHVVCACFPEEDHELGLLGAALRFRHAGFRVTYLGARTPPDALGRMVESSGAHLVGLSAINTMERKELRSVLGKVFGALPRGAEVVIGGAGAQRHPDVCAQLGAQLIQDDEDWESLLR